MQNYEFTLTDKLTLGNDPAVGIWDFLFARMLFA